MNSDPDGTGLNLNVSETDNALSFDLALEVAPFFRLKEEEAELILREIKAAVNGWEEHAREFGIPRAEQEMMRGAFAT